MSGKDPLEYWTAVEGSITADLDKECKDAKIKWRSSNEIRQPTRRSRSISNGSNGLMSKHVQLLSFLPSTTTKSGP